jgi:hypothetical protein
MRVKVLEWLGGTTIKLTWVNTGTIPSGLTLNLLDRNEQVVSSVSPVASGNGHYFAPLFLPTSDAYYVGRSQAVLDAATYVNRVLIKTHKLEVS